QERLNEADLAQLTLPEWFDASRDNGGSHRPEVLIFDQFEEILTVDPADQAGKQEFFTQLGAALRDRNRWALFAIREEYVGALDPFLPPIPTRLANRFHLERLGPDAARRAIQSPADQCGVRFSDEAAQLLIDNL